MTGASPSGPAAGGAARCERAGERGSERGGARARGAVSSLPRAARSAPGTATAPGAFKVLAASGVFTRDRVRGSQRGPEVDIRPTPRRRPPGAARKHTAACTMSQRGSRGNSHSSTSGGATAVTTVLPSVAFREKRIRSVILSHTGKEASQPLPPLFNGCAKNGNFSHPSVFHRYKESVAGCRECVV